MADKRISELDVAAALDGTELVPIVQGGETVRTTLDAVATFAGDVDGPASSTDNAIARFDGTTGKDIQNSSATIDDNGSLVVTPSAGTHYGAAINQTISGTATAGQFYANIINISDSADFSATALGGLGFYVQHLVTGGVGGRAAVYANLSMSGATTGANQDLTAIAGHAFTSVNNGGTVGTPRGELFGANFAAGTTAAATFLAGVKGVEIDTAVVTGSSVTAKVGLHIAQVNTDAVSGSTVDAGIRFANQVGAVGWDNAILLDDIVQEPVKTTGTIFKTTGSWTVAGGIDFSSLTITGNFLAGPSFSVSGSGVVSAASIELGHASANTLTASGGELSIEGAQLLKATTAASTYQPLDATLTSLAAYNTNGLLTQTAADTFTGRTVTGTANQITVTNGDGVAGNPTLSLPADVVIPTVVTVPNTGLHLLDTNASHDLIIAPGSDLTADHTLTLTTGDADRTITLSGNPTLADWFDQSVKQAASPTFAAVTIGASVPFSDAAGTLTLQNVDALDATTESTVEAAIDTLANLTSIQGRTVTLADAGADALFGWDDSASAYQNLSAADAITALGLASLYQPLDTDLTTLSTAFTTASATGAASLAFHEDTDNGTNRALLQGPASTADVTVTLPAATTTLVGTDTTDTLTNKTLTSPTMTTPVLGTPTSGTLTNCAGLPISTGVSGLGTNVATFLATPSSSNLASALTDEVGTAGGVIFGVAGTTWTPILRFGGASTNIGYDVNTGKYVTIGKFVFASFEIVLNDSGTATGRASISGLPSTPNAVGGGSITFMTAANSISNPTMYAYTDGIIYLENINTGTHSDMDHTNFGDTTQLFGTVQYIIA
jgi:hypothetical protein